jgi:hypothetical protein
MLRFFLEEESFEKWLEMVKSKPVIDEFKTTFQTKNREVRYMVLSANQVQSKNKEVVYSRVSMKGASEIVKAEIELSILEAHRQSAEMSNRLKTEFISRMSHEVIFFVLQIC